MLKHVFTIPYRYKPNTVIDTTHCNFLTDYACEDLISCGREYQLPEKFYKYKTIHELNNEVYERIYISYEPINQRKEVEVYPIGLKIYPSEVKFPNGVKSFKFVNKSCELLKQMGSDDPHATIKQVMLRELFDAAQDYCLQPLAHCVLDFCYDHREEINNLVSHHEVCSYIPTEVLDNLLGNNNDNEYISETLGGIYLSSEFKDLDYISKRFLKKNGPESSERLKNISSTPMYMYIDKTMPKYKLPKDVICKPPQYANEYIISLLDTLETSPYTDVMFVLDKLNPKRSRCDCKSKFTFVDVVDRDNYVRHILLDLEGFANAISDAKWDKIEVVKTYQEELFIKVYIGKRSFNFYFDIIMYGIGTPCLIDYKLRG